LCVFEQNADWNFTVLKKAGRSVDYVSAHLYSAGWGPFDQDNYLQSLYIPLYIEKLHKLTLSAMQVADNDICDRIKVAWDEWNMFGWLVDGVDDDKRYTLQNAIMTASVLNMFVRNSDTVGMANYSTFVNISGAMSVKRDSVVLRPQYHAFDLLRNHTGSLLYSSDVFCDSFTMPAVKGPWQGHLGPPLTSTVEIPYIDCTATGNPNGELCLSLVNRHPEQDIAVDIDVYGGIVSNTGHVSYEIFHQELSAANTEEDPDSVSICKTDSVRVSDGKVSISLKKHSINLVKLQIRK